MEEPLNTKAKYVSINYTHIQNVNAKSNFSFACIYPLLCLKWTCTPCLQSGGIWGFRDRLLTLLALPYGKYRLLWSNHHHSIKFLALIPLNTWWSGDIGDPRLGKGRAVSGYSQQVTDRASLSFLQDIRPLVKSF